MSAESQTKEDAVAVARLGGTGRSFVLPVIVLSVVTLAAGFALGWISCSMRQGTGGTLVTVNGEPITQADVDKRLEDSAGESTVRALVDERLRLQFARKNNTLPTDTEVEAKLDEMKQQQPDFAARLTAMHQTEDDLRQQLRISLSQTNDLTMGVTVTDAEALAFYNDNTRKDNPQALYFRPETVTIAAIVTPKEDDAKRAVAALEAGKQFSDVAREMSSDPSAANGGLLPSIRRGDASTSQHPDLENKLFGLRPGERAGPMKIGANWWIIRCIDKKAETSTPFANVKEDCRAKVALRKGIRLNAARAAADWERFRKGADIVAIRAEYRSAALLPDASGQPTVH